MSNFYYRLNYFINPPIFWFFGGDCSYFYSLYKSGYHMREIYETSVSALKDVKRLLIVILFIGATTQFGLHQVLCLQLCTMVLHIWRSKLSFGGISNYECCFIFFGHGNRNYKHRWNILKRNRIKYRNTS